MRFWVVLTTSIIRPGGEEEGNDEWYMYRTAWVRDPSLTLVLLNEGMKSGRME